MSIAGVGGFIRRLGLREQDGTESTTPAAKGAVVFFSLAAAFAYRASVSLVPSGAPEDVYLIVLAAVLLSIALAARRSERYERYWQIPFAFFAFTVAGFAADVNVSPLQRAFVTGVLRETPSARDPLASTVTGTLLAQLFSTLCVVIPIAVLIKASGSDLASIFLSRSRSWVVVVVGLLGLLLFYYLVARGRTAAFFPHSGVGFARLLSMTPALLVLVLMNGLREELWFRGLFLKRYGQFLGPWSSNLLAAVIFTSFHVQVGYALNLLPFLAYAFVLALLFGYLTQRSGSLLGSVLFHAGSDIPIFVAYLWYVSR